MVCLGFFLRPTTLTIAALATIGLADTARRRERGHELLDRAVSSGVTPDLLLLRAFTLDRLTTRDRTFWLRRISFEDLLHEKLLTVIRHTHGSHPGLYAVNAARYFPMGPFERIKINELRLGI
jgi:hypothetical protein